jgi:hypothetical protein
LYNQASGQSVFLDDLNAKNFDPNTTLALNPAAWWIRAPAIGEPRLAAIPTRGSPAQ